MPNLMMFKGLPFDGPPKECQKEPKKSGCKIVYPFKVDLTTVKNEVFWYKGWDESQVHIFVLQSW